MANTSTVDDDIVVLIFFVVEKDKLYSLPILESWCLSGAKIFKNLTFFGAEITKIWVVWRQNDIHFLKNICQKFWSFFTNLLNWWNNCLNFIEFAPKFLGCSHIIHVNRFLKELTAKWKKYNIRSLFLCFIITFQRFTQKIFVLMPCAKNIKHYEINCKIIKLKQKSLHRYFPHLIFCPKAFNIDAT